MKCIGRTCSNEAPPGYKQCQRCRYYGKKWRERNPTYFSRYAKQNASKLSAKARSRRLLRVYGLTTNQWNDLFDSQGRCCAVCKSPTPKGRRGWHTDHDHDTGEVRGILCHLCNVALGAVEDSPEVLKELILYLQERHDSNSNT